MNLSAYLGGSLTNDVWEKMKMRALLAAVVLIATTSLLSAGEVELESRLESVTVFPRGAEATRSAHVKLSAGEHTLVLGDLPAGVVAGSVRVSGETSGGTLQIGAVDTRNIFVTDEAKSELDKSKRQRIEEQIESLEDQKRELEDTIFSAETQKSLLKNLATLPSRPAAPQSGGGLRTPDEWGQIYSLIGDRMLEAQQKAREARVAIRDIDKNIDDLRKQLTSEPAKRERRTEVKVSLAADADLEGDLAVRYQLRRATWKARYEARLKSGGNDKKPVLELIRRASVTQRTGEDWTDIALTLSTTEPQRGTARPRLGTLTVDFYAEPKPEPRLTGYLRKQKMAPASPAPASEAAPMDAMEGDDVNRSVGGMLAARKVVAVDRRASVRQAPFQALYVIAGRHTIKSDGATKKVRIDNADLGVSLDVRTVPSRNPTAYLYAAFTLAKTLRVLPGPVALFRDGVFVGNGRLPVLAAGESHELGFGIDDAVRVKFAALKRSRGETGTFSTSKTEQRRFKITVKNLHDRKVKVRVIDRLPVSGNEEIVVEPEGAAASPSAKDIGDRAGLIAWDLQLAPGAEKALVYGYQVSWPADKAIRFGSGPRPY